MQEIGIAAANRFRDELKTCLGAIDQSTKLGRSADGVARYSVAPVKSGGVVYGFQGDGRACIRIVPVERAVVVDHERVHHGVGVADAIGQYNDAACLAQLIKVAPDGIECVSGSIEPSRLEHDVGADKPCGHASEQLAVERIAFKRAWSLAGKPLGELHPAVAHPIYFKGGEVGIAGAQIANGDPVVGARRFYRSIKVIEFIAMGG